MTIEISGTTVRLLVIAILAATTVIVFLVRWFLQKQTANNLTKKYKDWKWSSPLEGRSKYPDVDAFGMRRYFLEYGMMVSLLLMILAFSWTSYEKKTDVTQYLGILADEIEMETPRTADPPPPPPPPERTSMQIVVSDLPETQAMIFKDQSIDAATDVVAPPPIVEQRKSAPPPPPPPPPIAEEEREIFRVVEQQPMFPGCEQVADKVERYRCAEENMLRFIYDNIQYPSMARENGVAGMVVVTFVVERDGSISNISLLRDVGAGCGEEAKRIVSMMPKWIPGKQRERTVRVQFTLPVRFKLE